MTLNEYKNSSVESKLTRISQQYDELITKSKILVQNVNVLEIQRICEKFFTQFTSQEIMQLAFKKQLPTIRKNRSNGIIDRLEVQIPFKNSHGQKVFTYTIKLPINDEKSKLEKHSLCPLTPEQKRLEEKIHKTSKETIQEYIVARNLILNELEKLDDIAIFFWTKAAQARKARVKSLHKALNILAKVQDQFITCEFTLFQIVYRATGDEKFNEIVYGEIITRNYTRFQIEIGQAKGIAMDDNQVTKRSIATIKKVDSLQTTSSLSDPFRSPHETVFVHSNIDQGYVQLNKNLLAIRTHRNAYFYDKICNKFFADKSAKDIMRLAFRNNFPVGTRSTRSERLRCFQVSVPFKDPTGKVFYSYNIELPIESSKDHLENHHIPDFTPEQKSLREYVQTSSMAVFHSFKEAKARLLAREAQFYGAWWGANKKALKLTTKTINTLFQIIPDKRLYTEVELLMMVTRSIGDDYFDYQKYQAIVHKRFESIIEQIHTIEVGAYALSPNSAANDNFLSQRTAA